MEWWEARKLSNSTLAGFQEIVRPPEAPKVSREMDWLSRQNLDIRESMLELLDLVSCNMRIVGLSWWIFFLSFCSF